VRAGGLYRPAPREGKPSPAPGAVTGVRAKTLTPREMAWV